VTASAGFIWGMYVKINSDIGLSISSNILKTLASGIATNLVMYATGCLAGVALASVASFIPVVGTAVSCATMGLLCYVLTLASGYVYLKLLIHLFRAGKDINKMSADELKSVAKDVCSKDEIKNVMKEAKAEYKIGEKNGEFKQAE
jgi:type III secretory pathway component EscU